MKKEKTWTKQCHCKCCDRLTSDIQDGYCRDCYYDKIVNKWKGTVNETSRYF